MGNIKMDLSPVYILLGEEELLKESALAKIKHKYLPAENHFNYISLDGRNTSSIRVIEECQQLPFMADIRLVVVKDAEWIIDDNLLGYIQNPAETTCLVLSINKIDKRHSAYKTLEKYAEVQEFNHPNEREIPGWIEKYILSKKKRISPKDASYIADILENNLTSITQELDKLITFAGGRNIITEDDIETIVSSNKLRDSFSLTEAIQDKDTPNAIKLVNDLLSQGNSVQQIIGTIRWMLTRLWQVKEGDVKELHIPSYFLNKFIKQAQGFSTEELKNGLIKLLRTEKLIRTYTIEDRLILELLVVQLTEKTLLLSPA